MDEEETPHKTSYYLPKLTKWAIIVLRNILKYDYKEIKEKLKISSNSVIKRWLTRFELTGDVLDEFNMKGGSNNTDIMHPEMKD